MNNITISAAKMNEAGKIRDLETEVWRGEVTSIYDEKMFIKFGHVFVAKDKGEIIGAIISWTTKDDEIYIGDWIVNKNYRNKNVGQRLYHRLIKEVGNKPMITFINPRNLRSLETHKKLGFKIVKKVNLSVNSRKKLRYLVRRKKSYKH